MCKKNQLALQCDVCDLWVHIRCNNITKSKYTALQNENMDETIPMHKREAFYCIECLNNSLPFGHVDQNLFSTTNSLGLNLDSDIVEDLSITIDKTTKKQIDHITMLIKESNGFDNTPSFCSYSNVNKFNKMLSKNPSSFKVLNLNIASLQYHFVELEHLLNSFPCQFDIISITETKLRTNILPKVNINIPGYCYEHTPTDAAKGGTLLYISEKYNYKPRKDLEINISKQIESTFIEIVNSSGKNQIIGSLYRHHNITQHKFNNHLDLLLNKLKREDKPTVMTGDFNTDLLQTDRDNTIEQFYDNFTEKHFIPLVTVPTRIAKSSKTLIDNIFTNRFVEGTTSGNLTIGISDHMPQFCIIPKEQDQKDRVNLIYKHDYKNFNSHLFMQDLNEQSIDTNLKVTEYTEQFASLIKKVLNKHAPIRKMNKREIKRIEKPWITNDIIKKIKKKDNYYKKYIKESDPSKKETLNTHVKTMKNEITQMIRRSKHTHYKLFFLKYNNNARKLWQGVNEIINTKPKCKPTPTCINTKVNGHSTTVTDNSTIASTFNNYFANVADGLIRKRKYNGNKHFTSYLKNSTQLSFMMKAVIPQEIDDIIMNMNIAKGTGPFSIPPKIIKSIVTAISTPISHICNKSFAEGICPSILKISKIIPIHKKDSRLEVENYRPISLLSNINKIIEQLMFTRLYQFLNRHKCF